MRPPWETSSGNPLRRPPQENLQWLPQETIIEVPLRRTWQLKRIAWKDFLWEMLGRLFKVFLDSWRGPGLLERISCKPLRVPCKYIQSSQWSPENNACKDHFMITSLCYSTFFFFRSCKPPMRASKKLLEYIKSIISKIIKSRTEWKNLQKTIWQSTKTHQIQDRMKKSLKDNITTYKNSS